MDGWMDGENEGMYGWMDGEYEEGSDHDQHRRNNSTGHQRLGEGEGTEGRKNDTAGNE